jgi:hypothetical protein
MKTVGYTRILLMLLLAGLAGGCKMFRGPDKTGEFRLSSERGGTETYYLMGYGYEDSEFYRYPYEKDPLPDIINLGFRVLGADGQYELPGFTTPGMENGFARVGRFETMEEARRFYDDYTQVDENLQFSVDSDTVLAMQVWVQKTSEGNYVKLLVLEAESLEGDAGNKFSEALLEYTYQPDGSREFPD